MARYAPIAPIQLLHKMCHEQILGNYMLFLTHDVTRNDEQYDILAGSVRSLPGESFIIMDNGVIEVGNPAPVTQVLDAAAIVQADCVVLPDVLYDFEGTRDLISCQMMDIKAAKIPWMRVPQGEDMPEIVQCVDWLARNEDIAPSPATYWGIPRWITNKFGSRMPVIQYINAICDDPKIHLLGMSKNIDDDLRCCKLPGVMGIDSANPLVFGLVGRSLGTTNPYEHLHRGDFWTYEELTPEAIANVQYMHDHVSRP